MQHLWTSCSCKTCLGHTILLNISLSFLTQFDGKVRGYWTFRIIRNFSQFDTHVFFLHIKNNQYSFIISQFGFFNNILKDTKRVKSQIFSLIEPPQLSHTSLCLSVHRLLLHDHLNFMGTSIYFDIMLPSNHLARGSGLK